MWTSGFTLSVLLATALGGVYPNFRWEYEFQSVNDEKDWWKTAVFYQIYPRSFQDSDGDGIGDLKGVTQRLSYLKEIGVTATWLSPIFKSPMADFGYDIADFYAVDPQFGTMEDFDKMILEAKKVGVKIILDFVPNHSSDECDWFEKSAKNDKEYKDFYVWHAGFEDPNNKTNRLPPSNWVSVFRGSAWKWHAERKEFYLHQFHYKQPDLNYRNPKVLEKMKDVLIFWLSKGVDGFRIDAVPHVFECENHANGSFVNEPRNEDVKDPDDYGYLHHTCTVDQPDTLKLVYEWRSIMDSFQRENKTSTKVLLTEQWSPIETVMKYYGDGSKMGAHVPFNFFLISWISNSSDATKYAEVINMWLSQMNEKRIPNWVIGNHDKNRVGSRLGTDRIDMMNMIVMTLPGVAVTYQGEEIGMTDVWISWKDTVDPSACNSNPDIYEKLSRDPERTPFQWNDEKNAGFSTGNKTWLPVSPNYMQVNVKRERGIARSKLNIYKQLRALRNDNVFKKSFKAEVKAIGKNVLAISRELDNQHYITLVNINNEIESVNLKATFNVPNILEYAVVTDLSPHSFKEKIDAQEITLLPKEAVVLRSIGSKGSIDDYYYYQVV